MFFKKLCTKYKLFWYTTFCVTFCLIIVSYFIAENYRSEKGASRYILNHQNLDGSYDYIYFPKKDAVGYGYSLIRHFGTLYAMSDYGLSLPTAQTHLQEHLHRGITFGLTFTVPCDRQAPISSLCLYYEHDGGTFGTPSLAIVTLLMASELVHDEALQNSYLSTSIALENGIAHMVTNGNLMYKATATPRIARFEEGQLLLALTHLHKATSTKSYLKKASQLKDVIVSKLIKQKDYSLHHWYTLGLNEYYSLRDGTPTQKECSYFIKTTEHIHTLQVTEGEWIGAFQEDQLTATGSDLYKLHDPTITSAYVEGLGALSSLLAKCPTSKEVTASQIKITTMIDLAMLHITKQQITLWDIMFRGFSFNSLGGIYRNDSSYSIQIDTPQHALSAYMIHSKVGALLDGDN